MVRINSSYGVGKSTNQIFPRPVVATRAPTTSDKNHPLGRTWVRTDTGGVWALAAVSSGSATWTSLAAGGADVDTLTGDSGGAISPVGNDIILAGGTNVTTAGAGHTITFNLDDAVTLATSLSSPLYTVAAATDLQITSAAGQDVVIQMGDAAGANKVSFQDSGAVEVFSIDSDGGIPALGAVTINGLLTCTASATIQTGGTALNLGTDNSGDAVNIGQGNVARAISIGDGAAHTISIGGASTGNTAINAGAGTLLLDASGVLELNSSAGVISIANDDIDQDVNLGSDGERTVTVGSTNGAAALNLLANTGNIVLGNTATITALQVLDIAPTGSRTTTINGGTVITASVTDTLDLAPDGATTNADSVKTVNVNGGNVTTGQILTNIATGTITSGTHTVSIQTGNAAAGTVATNVSTGTGTKTVNVGNADANTTINLDGPTNINDSVNGATQINTGTSTGAVTIGNSAAGAIGIDTDAAFTINADDASTISVTAGALDLDSSGAMSINSSAGAINVGNDDIDQAVNVGTDGERTVTVGSVNGAAALNLLANTGNIVLGNTATITALQVLDVVPTSTRTSTINGGAVATAVTDTLDLAPDGVTGNAAAIKTVNLNAGAIDTGQILTNIASGTITSGTHTVSIQTGNAAAGTVATNISTGTGTKTVSCGNADANTTINLDGPTNINDSVNAATQINTGTSTGAVTIGNSAAGAIALDTDAAITIEADDASTINITAGALDVDSSGALSINSSAGAINIGNDDIDQAVNIASDGERTVTVGSTNGAASLTLQSGTTDITVTGTVKEISAEFLEASGDEITAISQNPILQAIANTGAAPVGTIDTANIMHLQNGVATEIYNVSDQTIIAPRMDANGLNIALDQAVGEGCEINWGAARTNSRHAFTIGTDAAFFFTVGLYINDMDGAAPYVIGFRKSEANLAAFANYTDYACVGMNAATSGTEVVTIDELNGGGQNITNTAQLWGGDGTTNTLTVLVSAAGVVTYQFNGGALGGAGAFTFDNADVVCPFIRVEHTASATDVAITSLKVGYQA